MKKDTLILGLGSNILTDAGIGLRLVNDLQSSGLINKADFKTAFLCSLEILELIDGYKTLIIIDGIKTEEGRIGNVKVFSLAEFHPTIHLINIHDFEFSQIIELGSLLGLKIPEEIRIISIEIKDNLTFSDNLSKELAAKYLYVRKKVINQIEDIIQARSFVI